MHIEHRVRIQARRVVECRIGVESECVVGCWGTDGIAAVLVLFCFVLFCFVLFCFVCLFVVGTHTHTHVHTHMHTRTHTHVHIHARADTDTHRHTHTHIGIERMKESE